MASMRFICLIVWALFLFYFVQLKKASEQNGNGDDKASSIEVEELAMNDKDERSAYDEEADEMDIDIDNMSQHMTTSMTVDEGLGLATKSNGKSHESSHKLDLPNPIITEVCPSGFLIFFLLVGLYFVLIFGYCMNY